MIEPGMTRSTGGPAATVTWDDDVEAVVRGDLTAALAYVTPAGGVVVTAVAPVGCSDRETGRLGFTTSLGLSKKLQRICADPRIALAFHSRLHGFATDPMFVLGQGLADVDLTPSRQRLLTVAEAAERYVGPITRGRLWDRYLHEYYLERVVVDVAVRRMQSWSDRWARSDHRVAGLAPAAPAPPQEPPARGTSPRVDINRLAARVSKLPHRLLAYRGADGYPVVVPLQITGHGAAGLRLQAADGLLPSGGRRAGLLAHAYHPQLVGLSSRTMTGWLDVGEDGGATYAPHTAKGWTVPPSKPLILVANGMLAKIGYRRAVRAGVLQELQALQQQAGGRDIG